LGLTFCISFWWPKGLISALLGGGPCSNQKEATSQALGSWFCANWQHIWSCIVSYFWLYFFVLRNSF